MALTRAARRRLDRKQLATIDAARHDLAVEKTMALPTVSDAPTARPKDFNPLIDWLRTFAAARNGGDEKYADSTVKAVLKKHGKDPDTKEVWMSIFIEIRDQSDQHGRLGRGDVEKPKRKTRKKSDG